MERNYSQQLDNTTAMKTNVKTIIFSLRFLIFYNGIIALSRAVINNESKFFYFGQILHARARAIMKSCCMLSRQIGFCKPRIAFGCFYGHQDLRRVLFVVH
jgi:hypothetical protein